MATCRDLCRAATGELFSRRLTQEVEDMFATSACITKCVWYERACGEGGPCSIEPGAPAHYFTLRNAQHIPPGFEGMLVTCMHPLRGQKPTDLAQKKLNADNVLKCVHDWLVVLAPPLPRQFQPLTVEERSALRASDHAPPIVSQAVAFGLMPMLVLFVVFRRGAGVLRQLREWRRLRAIARRGPSTVEGEETMLSGTVVATEGAEGRFTLALPSGEEVVVHAGALALPEVSRAVYVLGRLAERDATVEGIGYREGVYRKSISLHPPIGWSETPLAVLAARRVSRAAIAAAAWLFVSLAPASLLTGYLLRATRGRPVETTFSGASRVITLNNTTTVRVGDVWAVRLEDVDPRSTLPAIARNGVVEQLGTRATAEWWRLALVAVGAIAIGWRKPPEE